MAWDEQRKLKYLLVLPWTIYTEQTPEGDRLVRVRELPSVIGSGSNDEEIEQDFWDSLEATLRSYLHFDDDLPLPFGMTALPWKQAAAARPTFVQRRTFRVVNNRQQLIDQPGTTTLEQWKEKQFA